MGLPFKIVLNGEPVFLCCKGCVDEAHAHAERTLATVAKLTGTDDQASEKSGK